MGHSLVPEPPARITGCTLSLTFRGVAWVDRVSADVAVTGVVMMDSSELGECVEFYHEV
jgi:hypothetical protein